MILLISSVSSIKIDCVLLYTKHLTKIFAWFHDVSKNAKIFSYVTAYVVGLTVDVLQG